MTTETKPCPACGRVSPFGCCTMPAPEPQEDNLQAALILERNRYKAEAVALRAERDALAAKLAEVARA